MAVPKSPTFDTFLQLYKNINNDVVLALNIKSDGLTDSLKKKLKEYDISNYFVFDMSIPDTIHYKKQKVTFFIRQSEFEKELPFYEEADGVWLDMFKTDWVNEDVLNYHLNHDKKVCIVSPELHKRDHSNFWNELKKWNCINDENLFMCTDFINEAKRNFLDEIN